MSAAKLAPEEGILELPTASGPLSLWAFTCPTPGCSCRTATVLGTTAGREALIARGAPVRDAWLRGASHADAAALLTDVAVFVLDLDDGEALALDSDADFDFDAHPEARAVFDRVDGDVLEEIGRLWYRGKGWPNPEEAQRQMSAFRLEGWQPGDLVSWGDIFVGVRRDFYRFGERLFEAEELYCVARGCDCGEVVVDFIPLVPRGAPEPGSVRIARSEEVELMPDHEKQRKRLADLWGTFQRRHPKYRERFARRASAMQEIASRVEAETQAPLPRRTKEKKNR